MIVYGINPVLEALRAGHVRALQVSRRPDARLQAVIRLAEARGVPVRRLEAAVLDHAARAAAHQGVVAELDAPAAVAPGAGC